MTWPLEDLLKLTRDRETGVPISQSELGRRLGMHPTTIQRWVTRGIPTDQADRAAVVCGFDPYNVWPAMLNDLVDTVEQVCARDVCDNVFVTKPKGPHRRYCSDRCRWASNNTTDKARESRAARSKIRYWSDPEFREKRLASKRAWYRDDPEAARAAERRRYHRVKEAG